MSTSTHVVDRLNNDVPDSVVVLAARVAAAGGSALVIGGAVRDSFLGRTPTDVDIEVHGLPLDTIRMVASTVGLVREVGASFGVLKVRADDVELDVSVPRRDSKRPEANRRGIVTDMDPFMGIREAARRRDFTMNAIGVDLAAGAVHDPFHGLDDLSNGVLRVVDAATFAEDPLRVLRAGQFCARFGLSVDEATRQVLAASVPDLPNVSAERCLSELHKLLTKSAEPSVGLRLLFDVGALGVFLPDVAALAGVPQREQFHPEGDALEHTFQSVDAAVVVADREQLNDRDRFVLLLAALLHDIGKRPCFDVRGDALGHDSIGAKMSRRVLADLRADNDASAMVESLIAEHMRLHTMDVGISDSAIRRLADRLHPASVFQLVMLSDADSAGRDNRDTAATRSPEGELLLRRCRELGAETSRVPDFVTGKMLVAAGLTPGREFKALIEQGNRLRDDHQFTVDQVVAALVTQASGSAVS